MQVSHLTLEKLRENLQSVHSIHFTFTHFPVYNNIKSGKNAGRYLTAELNLTFSQP